MTTHSTSFLGLAAIFAGAIARMDHVQAAQMEKAALIIEKEAKRVLGTHDYGWPPLAAATLTRKAGNTPGLETGLMRDSVEHVSNKDELQVGSNEDRALWFEMGTINQPPRPFLSGALTHKLDEVKKVLGKIPEIAFQASH